MMTGWQLSFLTRFTDAKVREQMLRDPELAQAVIRHELEHLRREQRPRPLPLNITEDLPINEDLQEDENENG